MKQIAIITGASSGIGKRFAETVNTAGNFDEVWVIARSIDRLEALKETVPFPIRAIALDLSDKTSYSTLEKLLTEEKPSIRLLVNASGFGKFCATLDAPLDVNLNMIDLNCKALMAVTYLTLPYMHEGSKVYQLGSLSAFQPVPYITTYGATKAFVLSFSRALNKELKGRGIKMISVCPGWVKTEFFDRAVKDDTIKYYNKFFTSQEVVDRAVKDMNRGKDVSVCGASIRGQVLLTKLLPHKIVMSIWCKQQKK